MRKVLVCFWIVFSVLATAPITAQQSWTNQTPDIFVALFGNGVFVAAGEVIKISPDGRTWTTLQEHPSSIFGTGAFGNGRFLLSTKSILAQSTNGYHWQCSSNFQAADLTFAQDLFWAVGVPSGDTGTNGIFKSADGDQWTEAFRPPFAIKGIGYANGQFVATSVTNEITRFFVSTDGSAWNETPSLTGRISGLGFIHGQYIANLQTGSPAVPHVEISPDLTNWTAITFPTTNTVSNITYASGQYRAAFANGEILSSVDAVNWSPEAKFDVEIFTRFLSRPEGLYLFGLRGWILFSTAVGSWEVLSPIGLSSPETAQSIAYQSPNFYAAVREGVISSTDATRWSLSLTNAGPITALLSTSSNLFAFGPGTAFQRTNNQWTSLNMNQNFFPFQVVRGGNQFVAGSQRSIFTSPDGSHWSMSHTTANFDFQHLAYGNGFFVAVSDSSNPSCPTGNCPPTDPSVTSIDGMNWQPVTIGVPGIPHLGLAFGNGVFISVEENYNAALNPPYYSDLYLSTNGLNWTRTTQAAPQAPGRILFANGLFFLFRVDGLAISSDGVDWQFHPANYIYRPGKLPSSLAYGAFRYVGVGGMVLTSIRSVSLETVTPTEFELTLEPGSIERVSIQESTDLVNWGPVNTRGGDLSSSYAITAARSQRRFFRAKENP